MDSCYFKELTGLSCYEGFKNLLKSGTATQRYGCDDNTIVFNTIRYHNSTTALVYSLNVNQVAVIVSSNNVPIPVLLGPNFVPQMNWWRSNDVNGYTQYYQNVKGGDLVVAMDYIANSGPTFPGNDIVTFVIFDLY